MKRWISVITMLIVLGISLTGCSSSGRIEELEKRVDYLERIVLNSQTDSSIIPPSYNSTANYSKVESDDNDSVDEYEYAFLLEGMSAEEILDCCNEIFDNIPQEGQSYESYRKSLKVQPLYYIESSRVEYYYVCLSDDNSVVSGDYSRVPISSSNREAIVYIWISGIQMEMDGNIGYTNNGNGKSVQITVQLAIDGYEKAANLYDKLFDLVSPSYLGPFNDITDIRDSTEWWADGLLGQNGSFQGIRFLSMKKMDNLYLISVTKTIYLNAE